MMASKSVMKTIVMNYSTCVELINNLITAKELHNIFNQIRYRNVDISKLSYEQTLRYDCDDKIALALIDKINNKYKKEFIDICMNNKIAQNIEANAERK